MNHIEIVTGEETKLQPTRSRNAKKEQMEEAQMAQQRSGHVCLQACRHTLNLMCINDYKCVVYLVAICGFGVDDGGCMYVYVLYIYIYCLCVCVRVYI